MRVDPTTLSDLEVVQDREGGGGLLAIVDETTTAVGRKALQRRLEAPFSEIDEIRRVQEAVQFFVLNPDLFRIRVGSVEGVERFLRSNIQTSRTRGRSATAVEALWLAVRYRDLYREVHDGVHAASRLVGDLVGVAEGVTRADPPPVVADLVRELIELCATLSRHAGIRSRSEVFRADHVFRGPERPNFERVLELVGEIDALRSMASATRRMRWCMPDLVESEQFVLEGEGLWHPFVPDAVRNPIDLSGGEPMVFLTGPNMAGKTTYLRSAALCVLLAQTGMGVPARRMRLTPVEVLFTSLNPSDNLRAGLSFFLAEILRVRAAAEVLADGQRAFVLFDEVFKGTNVRDALEASAAVILGFAKARGSGFIFSSHLVELVDSLRSNPRVRFHCFDGQIVKGRAEYSYRIQSGVSDKGFGLHLLNEARIPDLLERIGA